MDNIQGFTSQIAVAAIFSYLLQTLKRVSWFPILTEDSAKAVKVFFAALTSVCAATGLTYVYNPTAHTVLISNFSLVLVGHALWQWVTQFVVQEGWYQLVFNKPKLIISPSPAQSSLLGMNAATKK